MQERVKLPCMGYMLLLTPRSVVDQFVVIPAVTVSDCWFRGVRGFCVNVRIPLQLFSLVSPSAWHLSIITNGRASSDWLLGPMLMSVCLCDVCVVMGSSLMFLVFFFCLCVDKKRLVISILSQQVWLDADGGRWWNQWGVMGSQGNSRSLPNGVYIAPDNVRILSRLWHSLSGCADKKNKGPIV